MDFWRRTASITMPSRIRMRPSAGVKAFMENAGFNDIKIVKKENLFCVIGNSIRMNG